jgi:anti-sigma factor RsiW
MRRCASEELLLMLAENELSEKEARSLTGHAERCDRCGRLLHEYRRTLAQLPPSEIQGPTPAEWAGVMATVRERVSKRTVLFPVWARGTALAAAAAVVLAILWQAGIFTGPERARMPELVQQEPVPSGVAPRDVTPGTTDVEEGLQKRLAEEPAGGVTDMWAEDTETALSLASVEDDLLELDDWVVGVGGSRDSDYMLLYLTEEEEATLVRDLENSPSI